MSTSTLPSHSSQPQDQTKPQRRDRVRSILPTLFLGHHKPGPKNSLTDVPNVLVSTTSIHKALGHDPSRPKSAINTGVTCILPRKDWFDSASYAGIHRLNGSGELTGSHWLEETGLLNSPIILTNSLSVGDAYNGVYKYAISRYADVNTKLAGWFLLPVVGETFDGFMNDVAAMAVTSQMIVDGIDNATSDAVQEGNTGGGTGMLCQGFKAGTGSSSRIIPGIVDGEKTSFTVGALAQVNFGKKNDLRFGSVPVGRLFIEKGYQPDSIKPGPSENEKQKDGSIIVVIATDAPLHPLQLKRLAQRASIGVGRTGGWGSNSSGDIFIAFSTGNTVPREPGLAAGLTPQEARFVANVEGRVKVVQDTTINGLFEGAVEATEEAILNALCMAEDMEGVEGNRAEAIDLERLREVVDGYCGGR